MRVEFAERIDNSEKSVSRQSSQSENRNADTQILEKLRCFTDELAPRPSFDNKDDRREGHLENVGRPFQFQFKVKSGILMNRIVEWRSSIHLLIASDPQKGRKRKEVAFTKVLRGNPFYKSKLFYLLTAVTMTSKSAIASERMYLQINN